MAKGGSGRCEVMEAVMAADAPVNTGAPPVGECDRWVSRIQARLHCWAAADHGRRFDDLFNLVHHPVTLAVAWERVASNRGAGSAGSDGLTVARIASGAGGVSRFLDDLRRQLRTGTYRPQPVRQRKIPKPGGSGKLRRLGIPTVTDRVVQAALKLVLEPIFEADFLPVSYGFRPLRRAHDAIAEIQLFGTQGYRWVLDADIEACFDSIDHTALLARVRRRVKDKRVLALVRAFLKAGLLTELGDYQDTHTGTPQGGILSPLLANIALSVLDEALHAPWQPAGEMANTPLRRKRRARNLPNWRLVRYADDFVVLTDGNRDHLDTLREQIAQVLQPIGLRLSATKTHIRHLSEGFDFLGFHIQWRRKRGASKWHVYTFIADRPLRTVKSKIRVLTPRTSQANLKDTLIRINQITRGWANYFRHAVATRTFDHLRQYTWWRLVRWQRTLHRWRWKDVRGWLTDHNGRWKPITADGITLFNPTSIPIRRYRYRGKAIPNPFTTSLQTT
jgi:RNA-directed DNA polymerase